ncbi:hypothetical protein LWI28_009975 [Acer negundo]|uniref:peptidylprolyl isomerase n=1 Tax=Acer negundo TaxID=4023 RepID=A0AAD5NPW9_ACENE|nr:hypothetical protein LWI28_009975 [Acer negundo]
MAEAIKSFAIIKPHGHSSHQLQSTKWLSKCSRTGIFNGLHKVEGMNKKREALCKVNAWPLTVMAVLVEHAEGQRDLITHKSVWHLSDHAIKNVYLFYIMFTCWGCLFFGATKDPYYDSEVYRGDGGDGTGHWFYEKQEEIEEAARAELWREELIEEIEQKENESEIISDSERDSRLFLTCFVQVFSSNLQFQAFRFLLIMGKDSKSKDAGGKGKGKQAAGGGDENASKGKGKGGKAADGLGTCTYVKARHVLCEKQGKINEAYKKLQDGWLSNGDKVPPAEFAKIAAEYSECPSGKKGGDLGWFPRGKMAGPFQEVAFNTPVGATSAPFKSTHGYHIILSEGRKN